ncbi:MAG: type IX secretion system membrane protein PorP/SprF [Bacteroidota bacterium]
MKKILLFGLLCVLSWSAYGQQESQYTMFMHNKLYFNPAYAGVRGIPSAHILYRKQWFGFEGAPESKMISFNTPLSKDRVGFGLNISNHDAGFIRQWIASMAYSYNIRINDETSLRVGLQGSMRYYGIDFSDPAFFALDEGDPSVIEATDTEKYKGNVGAGFYLIHKNFYIGGSSPSILQNSIGFNADNEIRIAQEVPHFYVMSGMLLELNSSFKLQPALLGKYVQNAPPDLEVNCSLIYENRVTTGISYRLGGTGAGESIDIIALYQAGQLALGMAYDFTISEFSQHTVGSLEALVRFDFVKETTKLANPRFFY